MRVILACSGVPRSAGDEAAVGITAEFREHRHWHRDVKCTWDGERLRLEADNDFDLNGLAIVHEFSDCLSAFLAEPFDGDITVESGVELGQSGP